MFLCSGLAYCIAALDCASRPSPRRKSGLSPLRSASWLKSMPGLGSDGGGRREDDEGIEDCKASCCLKCNCSCRCGSTVGPGCCCCCRTIPVAAIRPDNRCVQMQLLTRTCWVFRCLFCEVLRSQLVRMALFQGRFGVERGCN